MTKLTPEQILYVVDQYETGRSLNSIAKDIGVTHPVVGNLLRHRGIKVRNNLKSFTPEQKQDMINLYKSGVPCPAIAERYNASRTWTHTFLKQAGVLFRSREEYTRRFELRLDFFDSIDSEAKAYILGFICADGCNTGMGIKLALAYKDVEILEYIVRNLYPNDQLRPEIKQRLSKTDGKTHPQCNLYVASKDMCNKLNEMGVTPRKSLSLKFPENIRPDLMNHFIRGYFDGDGGVHLRKDAGTPICSIIGTQSFIQSIIVQLLSVCITNINTKVKHTQAGVDLLYLLLTKRSEIYKFYKYLYADATFWLSRKRDKLKNIERMVKL